jgi:amidase
MDELCERTAVEQRALLADRVVSSRELLDAHLARIEAVNPRVNAVVALDPQIAYRRARAVDDAVANGAELGPLAGLVTAHKDLTDTADFPTTYGSPRFAGFRPSADSVVVARMGAAGAVAIGKTNVPEFGAGSHTFNPVYGTTRNPWDPTRSAGGSSGGAAVALTCGMVAVADGGDVGGSLRNPAAWNNVVGFRPTPGSLPAGILDNPWLPLSTEGPMARTVADAALLFSVLAAPGARDPWQRPVTMPSRLDPPGRPLRVAWSRDVGGAPIEPGQIAVLEGVRHTIEDLGWAVVDDEPDFRGADECFATLRAWRFATGTTGQFGDEMESVKATVQDEVRRGRLLSPRAIADAYAQLGAMWRRAADFFTDVDLLVAPVTQVAPFPVECEYPCSINGVALANYISWMAVCWRITVLGVPALSLPAGFDDRGLPVGLQLIARAGGDVDLLRAAATLEAASPHHHRRPSLISSGT